MACCLIAPKSQFAQQPLQSGLIRDANSQLIAQRVMQATGVTGQSRLSCEVLGDITVDGDSPLSYQIVIKSLGSHRQHTELTTPKGTRHVYIKDGHGMLVRENGQQMILLPQNLITQRSLHIPTVAFSEEYADPNLASEYGKSANGQESLSFQSRTASKAMIQALESRVDITTFSVDSQTGRIAKVDYHNVAENAEADIQDSETIYSDYREIDGLWIPFQQDTYANGRRLTRMIFRSADCRQSFPESEFDIPELKVIHAR